MCAAVPMQNDLNFLKKILFLNSVYVCASWVCAFEYTGLQGSEALVSLELELQGVLSWD